MMRRRVFTPDALGRLEDRAMLSGATHAGGPVVLSSFRLIMALDMDKKDFELFATGQDTPHNFGRLRSMLSQNAEGLPFHKVDHVGKTINAILDQMQADIAAGAPHPIATAHQALVAATYAEVQMRVDDGSVVLGR